MKHPLLVVLLAIAGFALLHNVFDSERSTPAPVTQGPDYNTPSSHRRQLPSVGSASGVRPQPISVDSTRFLAEYRTDESAANARYKNQKVEITGTLTGVFVPSFATSMRMAGKGFGAYAFVTMGGLRPSSAEEALFIPGISAYTESSSFFGFQNPAAANLMTGETVTVVCTCGDAFRVSGSDYSVTLENCTLEPSITAPDTAEPVSEETSITPRPEAAQQ